MQSFRYIRWFSPLTGGVVIYLGLSLLLGNMVEMGEIKDIPSIFLPSIFSPPLMRAKGRSLAGGKGLEFLRTGKAEGGGAEGKGDAARYYLMRAILLDPLYSYTFSSMAWIDYRAALLQGGPYTKGGPRREGFEEVESLLKRSLKHMRSARELDRTNPFVLYSSASLLLGISTLLPYLDIEPALLDLREALNYEPELFDEVTGLLERMKVYPVLMEWVIPERKEVIVKYGIYLEQRGELEKAKEILEWCISIFPDYPEAHYRLGSLLNRIGEKEEGEEHLRTAILYHSDNPWYRASLAYLLLSTGRYDEAASHFKRALMVKPESTDLRVGLARVLKAQKRIEAAEEELKAILKSDPSSDEARKILETLRDERQ